MNNQPMTAENRDNEAGFPAGGSVISRGMYIEWQDGPLGSGEDRQEPNGAFVETVLRAAIQRMEYYQSKPFRCRENALAITHMEEALHWLTARTAKREAAGVEGTHAYVPGEAGSIPPPAPSA